jgi:hypothetical protein
MHGIDIARGVVASFGNIQLKPNHPLHLAGVTSRFAKIQRSTSGPSR